MNTKQKEKKEKERRKLFKQELQKPGNLDIWMHIRNSRIDRERKLAARMPKPKKKRRCESQHIPTDVGSDGIPAMTMAAVLSGDKNRKPFEHTKTDEKLTERMVNAAKLAGLT